MPVPKTCPKCGGLIAPDAVAGQCPACLIGVADLPPPSPDVPLGGLFQARRFGDYVLGRQLGSGGMGIVYEAHQTSLNRKVALKFIRDSQVASPMLLRRFTIEAEATARLHHPGIVGIHEIGELEGHPYFSMDLVEGENLRSAMSAGRLTLEQRDGSKSNGRSRQVEIARLMAKTARAVHHAHERGVLHRDLKPANILIDRHEEPRLTDFGLAKILRDTTEDRLEGRLTPKTEVAGTPSYMSPEQAASDETTGASDIYGLGAVLYEMLTGHPPFKAATFFETLTLVQNQPPRRPRAMNPLVHEDLETICLKCLEKNPAHRYFSAEALADDLERWIEHRPITACPPTAVTRVRRWIRRNPGGTILIAVLFFSLVGALILLGAVDRQRKRFELQQAILFDERVKQLKVDWEASTSGMLMISARDLAILDNRTPLDDPDARPLSFGSISDDPISDAAKLTRLLADLESTTRRILRVPVQVSFGVVKNGPQAFEPLLLGQLDFMVMGGPDYLLLKKTHSEIKAFARFNTQVQGALACNDSAVTNLQQLAGKRIVFPTRTEPLTIFAKARLADAGLAGKDFRALEYIDASDPKSSFQGFQVFFSHRGRGTASAVARGDFDAGITYLRRLHLEGSPGLKPLDAFTSTPLIFVARAGLDTNVITAFQAALRQGRVRNDFDGTGYDWDETFPGAVPIDDAYFNPLREAMRKAARFDGLPDPFPPEANLP